MVVVASSIWQYTSVLLGRAKGRENEQSMKKIAQGTVWSLHMSMTKIYKYWIAT
jgi:hypothetical protein